MPRVRLTRSFVQKTVCPPNKRKQRYVDLHTRGLVLEVRCTGGKTYYVQYQDIHGQQRNFRIGNASSITLDAARTKAVSVLSKIVLGEDPLNERRAKRRVPTVAEFVADRYLPFAKGYKRSWGSDETLLRNHVLPVWGRRRLDSITLGDVTAVHHGLKARGYAPATANRVLILIRYLFNLAIKWGIDGVTENPSKGVDLFKVNNERQTFLSRDDVQILLNTLISSPNPQLYHIVILLLLTGARKQEALKAEWRDFDIDNRVWVIPETKSGRCRKVPLSDMLLALLTTLPARGQSPFLFPNPKTGRPYRSIFASWNSARINAGLAHVRIHDLRHSFASFLVNSGRSLYEVQRLLGHAHIKTTQRYAHLSNETLANAVNAVATFVVETPTGQSAVEGICRTTSGGGGERPQDPSS